MEQITFETKAKVWLKANNLLATKRNILSLEQLLKAQDTESKTRILKIND